jgi:hypothetical protein
MERQRNAYITPAAVILGVGLHNCVTCAYLLTQKARSASGGWIWRLSVLTLIFVFGFIFFQILILDFIASAYIVPDWWVGFVQMGNFIGHFLSAMGITAVLLIRLSVFYHVFSFLS